MSYRLTVRQGPKVSRQKFESLDAALAALEERAKDIRALGPLEAKKMIREFEPGDQVAGRVEISAGGFMRRGLRRRRKPKPKSGVVEPACLEAGIDVMGDGRFVAFAGGMRRSELDPGQDGPFEAVRRALL